MVLNYYLKNILHEHPSDDSYPSIHFVRSDLHRIARDLEPHCVRSHCFRLIYNCHHIWHLFVLTLHFLSQKKDFSEHAHVKKFTGNYKKASDLYGVRWFLFINCLFACVCMSVANIPCVSSSGWDESSEQSSWRDGYSLPLPLWILHSKETPLIPSIHFTCHFNMQRTIYYGLIYLIYLLLVMSKW